VHCFDLIVGILFVCITGGVMSHGITEVSGESASGKTQLCLQLCLTVQLSQSNGGLNAGKSLVFN